jgi:hypothetical protein
VRDNFAIAKGEIEGMQGDVLALPNPPPAGLNGAAGPTGDTGSQGPRGATAHKDQKVRPAIQVAAALAMHSWAMALDRIAALCPRRLLMGLFQLIWIGMRLEVLRIQVRQQKNGWFIYQYIMVGFQLCGHRTIQ